MLKTFLTIDETDAMNPHPVLHVNGRELPLTINEFQDLYMECNWIQRKLTEAKYELERNKVQLT